MHKSVIVLLLLLSLCLGAFARQSKSEQKPAPKQAAPQRSSRGFISPSEVNVHIESDVRTFVAMAAVNMAGFDYESAGQPLSPARAELRKDLSSLDPKLREELRTFYNSHRRAGIDEASDALRYAALSLLMTPPPLFSINVKDDSIPEDLKPLLPFTRGGGSESPALIGQLYSKAGLRQLAQKYLGVADVYAAAYRQPVGEAIFETLDYFHTNAETIINMRPLVISTGEPGHKAAGPKQRIVERNRTRQVFIIMDPLAPIGTATVRDDILNQKDDLLSRRIGDDYIVLVGPSNTPNTEAIRRALIRFVIDPLLERHLKTSLAYKDQITKLTGSIASAQGPFGASVYLVMRESLAQAAEARMKRIEANHGGGSYSEDDATYDLAQAYLRGASLVFHFYESLIGLEKVGISIEDFFDQMLATSNFERESKRAADFESTVAKVSAIRSAAAKTGSERAPNAEAAITRKIIQSDDLIRQRKFSDARPILDDILRADPRNARALYGMAQVINQIPSAAESDPKAEENDKIEAQHDRLERAIKLYRRAIESASSESERWMIQWSHVFIGRILDFQEFRIDAIAEYEKAIALGEVQGGAYKEAIEGKQKPFGQK
ncbi:MAG: hypothetical protein DMF61_19540 [Blastocatellia bacterium AA13]|nr:MAG: hypothetical protein DMF61_19540 [Blastocatellia bacterium AA13]